MHLTRQRRVQRVLDPQRPVDPGTPQRNALEYPTVDTRVAHTAGVDTRRLKGSEFENSARYGGPLEELRRRVGRGGRYRLEIRRSITSVTAPACDQPHHGQTTREDSSDQRSQRRAASPREPATQTPALGATPIPSTPTEIPLRRTRQPIPLPSDETDRATNGNHNEGCQTRRE